MKYLFAFFVVMLFIACHDGFLNPDPARGGDCKNGNQLCVVCPNGDTCSPPYVCNSFGKCDTNWDPGPDYNGNFGAKRDAGSMR